MQTVATKPSSVVSPRIYALIATSPELRRQVLPEGLLTSPYEVLDYQMTLSLHDPKGMRATFQRTQRIRFLQNGVSAIMDHAWGDGIIVTFYHHSGGKLEDAFKDEGKRHLVIGLKRPMYRGETLSFAVTRKAMAGFTQDEEWTEITVDHPVLRVRSEIVFPRERPCQQAVLCGEGQEVSLPILRLANGDTRVVFTENKAVAHLPYTVRWKW